MRDKVETVAGSLFTPIMGVPAAVLGGLLIVSIVRWGHLLAMVLNYMPPGLLGTLAVLTVPTMVITILALILIPAARQTGALLAVATVVWLAGGGALIRLVETAGLMPGLPFAVWTVMCVGCIIAAVRSEFGRDASER